MAKHARKPATKHKTNTKGRHHQTQQLRIIGGQWRGRKLAIADIEGLRPTGDRIRETLFNWLTGYLVNSHCIDLFAGSGALGIECLSRGASYVTLLEKHPQAAIQLRQHRQKLSAHNSQIIEADTLLWLSQYASEQIQTPIDIIFIDPPFAADIWDQAITLCEQHLPMSAKAMIYIETPKDRQITTPPHWSLLKEKQTGQVCYRLFQRII